MKELSLLEKRGRTCCLRRHSRYEKALQSDNPAVSECAGRLLDVNIWELWALTQ